MNVHIFLEDFPSSFAKKVCHQYGAKLRNRQMELKSDWLTNDTETAYNLLNNNFLPTVAWRQNMAKLTMGNLR